MFKTYGVSFLLTIIAVCTGYWLAGIQGAWIVSILCVLEISLSFDNAVVNASVLKNWDEVWRRRFIVWGMPIAVFGMRFVFPLLIVAIIAGVGPIEVLDLAMNQPDQYSAYLLSSHHQVAAFGGAFLLMVFLKYFLDAAKEVHWIGFIERPLVKLGQLEAVEIAIALVAIILFAGAQHAEHQLDFAIAGIWGIVVYVLAEAMGSLVGSDDDGDVATHTIKQGVAGFMYLELLDASFSFDGVLGAFALSNDIFIIALGLGVGAMFVRSMTLHLLEKGTLSNFIYLETGAFYAIGCLGGLMFVGTIHEVSEIITGTIGATIIIISVLHSILYNRKQAAIV